MIGSQADDRNLQAYFDSKDICFGVQWLIAKLVTHDLLSYEKINIPDLDKLRGTNEEATRCVAQLFARENSKGEAEGLFVKEKAIRVECFFPLPWSITDAQEVTLGRARPGAQTRSYKG